MTTNTNTATPITTSSAATKLDDLRADFAKRADSTPVPGRFVFAKTPTAVFSYISTDTAGAFSAAIAEIKSLGLLHLRHVSYVNGLVLTQASAGDRRQRHTVELAAI